MLQIDNRACTAAVQVHINILYLFAKLHCSNAPQWTRQVLWNKWGRGMGDKDLIRSLNSESGNYIITDYKSEIKYQTV